MTNQPNKRKRGRPTERPGAKRIGFYVSEADHEWLTALPNRSEWIAEKVAQSQLVARIVERERTRVLSETGQLETLDCAADRAPESPQTAREAS